MSEPPRADPSDASAKENRLNERIPILGDLQGDVMVFQPMSIKEVSRGGALIESPYPLTLNSLHDFRLTLGDMAVIVKGRVVHCSIRDVEDEAVLYRSGIEFIQPSDRVFSAITDFIDSIKAGRRSA